MRWVVCGALTIPLNLHLAVGGDGVGGMGSNNHSFKFGHKLCINKVQCLCPLCPFDLCLYALLPMFHISSTFWICSPFTYSLCDVVFTLWACFIWIPICHILCIISISCHCSLCLSPYTFVCPLSMSPMLTCPCCSLCPVLFFLSSMHT